MLTGSGWQRRQQGAGTNSIWTTRSSRRQFRTTSPLSVGTCAVHVHMFTARYRPSLWPVILSYCPADVNGENFDAAINAELRKISTFYVDKEEELDVSLGSVSILPEHGSRLGVVPLQAASPPPFLC